MENNEFKKVDIKNDTCCYFDDIIKLESFYFMNVLFDEKLYENILIYDVLYKTLIGASPLHILFDKIDGFIWDYNEIEYLV